jgi:hypothetical protein
MAEYRASLMKNNYDNKDNHPDNSSNDDTNNDVDFNVTSVPLEVYTKATSNPEYEHFQFSHYINGHS